MESITSIKKLFDESDIQFAVPAYQRAYSWEVNSDKQQVRQFLKDLIEQLPFIKVDETGKIQRKKYFLGHFMFEKSSEDADKYLIIDGQQRLTTVVIFMSAFIAELQKRENSEEQLLELNGKDPLRLNRLRENYLEKDGKLKFETVSYDIPDFARIVYKNEPNVSAMSASVRRVEAAYSFFAKELESIETKTLIKLKDIIDNTVVTTFEVEDKIQATEIFAFQNDRGKNLTSLEIIKSYLMHKIYSVAKDSKSAEADIKQMETTFSDIYKLAEEISYDEDSVLNYHCTAYIGLYGSSVDRVKNWIQDLQETDILDEIKNFSSNLKETFITIGKLDKEMLKEKSFVADCIFLRPSSCIPLFIKLYRFNGNSEDSIQAIAKRIENILFKLTYTVGDLRTDRLPNIALDYNGDLSDLDEQLKSIQKTGFQWWWKFSEWCKEYFEKWNWHYDSKIKYILWKYENSMREQHKRHLISPSGFTNEYGGKKLENTIDHITPQSPDFTEYSDDFKTNFLNNIGNLALISWGNNSQKSNKSPVVEKNKYDVDSDFISNKEIFETLDKNNQWTEKEITERKNRIVDFIVRNWELD